MGKSTKVLVGIPVRSRSGLPDYRTQWCLENLKSHTKCSIETFFIGGGQIPESMFRVVKKMLEGDFDFLLRTDSDMTFPPYALDRLLSHNKDVVAGLAVRKWPPYKPCAVNRRSGQWSPVEVTEKMVERGDLLRCDGVGSGFMLIKRSVLEGIRDFLQDEVYPSIPEKYHWLCAAPWFPITYDPENDTVVSTDFSFCMMARTSGADVTWLDCGLVCGHQGEVEYDIRDYWSWRKMYGSQTLKPEWPGQDIVFVPPEQERVNAEAV